MPAQPSLDERTALMQRHLVSISAAIVRTRREIAELRQDQQAGRTRDELHAVVQGTEEATDTILTASETVDILAGRIAGRDPDEATGADARAIQEQMQRVFEACNFQDLTGQRIAKVVRTVVLVEEHVAEMARLWAVPTAASSPAEDRRSEADALLNGPALPGVEAVSQDAVDALFD